jgi:hypothetical protein
VFATLAMMTRGSVGAGPLVAIGLVAAVYLLALSAIRLPRMEHFSDRIAQVLGVRPPDRPGRFAGGLLAAMAIPLALYVAVNEVKFDTPFSIPITRQVFSLENAHRQAVLASNGGSLFGLKFLPTNLLQFVRPDALEATRLFPWIFFPGKAHVVGNLLYDSRDWTSSIPSCMPVLFVLSLVGLLVVYRPRRSSMPGVASLRLPLVGAAAGTYGILTIAFIAQRYLTDAMPLLVLAALVGWHFVIGRVPEVSRAARRTGAVLLALISLFGVWTTFSLSLFYQRELGPLVSIPERAGMVSFQQQIDRSLFGGPLTGVRFVSQLPGSGQALDLAVIGNCDAVYQFDGNLWQPVELGAGGGAMRLRVTFAAAYLGLRQPLLVTGGASPQDVVAVTWEGGDLFSFSYLFDGTLLSASARTWYQEQAVAMTPGPHLVQIDLVSQLGMVYITVDQNPVFSLLYPVAPPSVTRIGSAPASIPTTARFAGSIRELPVPTPICTELERRRDSGTGTTAGPARN